MISSGAQFLALMEPDRTEYEGSENTRRPVECHCPDNGKIGVLGESREA
jgi:hypothetical protein